MNKRVSRFLLTVTVLVSLIAGIVIGLDGDGAAGPTVVGGEASKTVDVGGQRFIRWDTPRKLPAFLFLDENGRKVSMADFHGRVVLLNIWATWCPPCRKEMPSLDRLNAKRGGTDFEVVALSIDNDPKLVKPFYRESGIKTLRGYFDPNASASGALGTFAVPATLLIDKDGREVGRALGPAEWDSPAVESLIDDVLASSTKS